jgi:hypothetical protein
MSGGQGSSVRNGASAFGSNGRLFGRSLDLVPTTPASAEQHTTANAFPPWPASSPLLFGRGNADDPHAWPGYVSGGNSMDADNEHMDESNDAYMGDDEPITAPATARSSLLAVKMGSHDVTERTVNDHGKKQLDAASGADSNAMMCQSLENGAANEPVQSPATPVVKKNPFVPNYAEVMRQTDKYGAVKESPGLIPDIGNGFDEIANGAKGPKATRQADPTKITEEDPVDFDLEEDTRHAPEDFKITEEDLDEIIRKKDASHAPEEFKITEEDLEELIREEDTSHAPEKFKPTDLNYDDVNESLKKKSRRVVSMSAAPKGPKASRQAAGGSSSRTGATGGVRKLANPSTARPTTSAGGRSMQDPGQPPASTRGTGRRQPQMREDRSARSTNAPLKGCQHASQNLRSQSQTIESRDEGVAKFGPQAAEGSSRAQLELEAFQNCKKTARGESSSQDRQVEEPDELPAVLFERGLDKWLKEREANENNAENGSYADSREQEAQKRLAKEKRVARDGK